MLFKRKIENDIEEWWKNNEDEALIISGPRQIGKTSIISNFCIKHCKNFISINFLDDQKYKKIFDDGFSEDMIIRNLNSNFPQSSFKENETNVLFIDEIQEYKLAITALKFMLQFKRIKFKIICSGSYLGITLFGNKDKTDNNFSWPVGYTKVITMYSMDFEEFLWVHGYDNLLEEIYAKYFLQNLKIPNSTFDKINELFELYLLIGGMPKILEIFLKTKDLNKVFEKQKNIINDYKSDSIKYTSASMVQKIYSIFDNLPQQYLNSNNSYNFSDLKKNANSRDYMESIDWLCLTKITSKCVSVSNDKPDILPIETSNFKLFFNDVGLFLALFNNFSNYLQFKNIDSKIIGFLKENFAANCIIREHQKLNYFLKQRKIKFEKNGDGTYRKVSYTIGSEIDFFLWKNSKLIPIEIKSSNNKATSLNMWSEKYHNNICYKVGNININKTNEITTAPLWLLQKIIHE